MKTRGSCPVGGTQRIGLAWIVALIVLSAELVWSQNYVWTDGSGTHLWNAPANWNPAGVPTAAGDTAVLNSGPVILDRNVNLDRLTLGLAGNLTLNSSRDLNFTGNLAQALTNRGTITSAHNTDLQFLGTVVNEGTIILDGGEAPAAAADIEVASDATLSGNGTITMKGSFARFNGRGGPTATLTVSQQSIKGHGFFGANDINIILEAGNVVDANVDGETLVVDVVDPFVNRGTLQASQGGILTFQRSTIHNTSGLIRALEASTVELGQLGFAAAHIQGGILRSTGSGLIQNRGGATTTYVTLEDVTIQGRFVTGHNTITNIEGGLTNEGVITLSSGEAFATRSHLHFRGNPVVGGGGTVFLNGPNSKITGEGNARPTFQNQTIEGSGSVDSNVNPIFGANSVINANVPGQTLSIPAHSGTPVVANGTINVAPESTLQISEGTQSGTFSNGGQIKVSAGLLANALAKIKIAGNTTLKGGGKIVMDGPSALLEGEPTGSVVVEDQTIEGSGTLAPSFLPTYGSKSVLHANKVGQVLDVQFPHTKVPLSQGFLHVNAGSTLKFTSTAGAPAPPKITHSGPVKANGTLSAPGSNFSFTKGSQITGFGFVQSKGILNNGWFSPGASPGTLTLTMDSATDVVEMGEDAVLDLEIGGTTPDTEHDVLDVQGGLALGGALRVSLLGFQPAASDIFTVVTQSQGFGALSGTFAGIPNGGLLTTADGGGTFTVNYEPASVTLTNFALTPFGNWKVNQLGNQAFDPAVGHPLQGDPNQNGTPLLLEYAFAMNPTGVGEEEKLPQAGEVMDDGFLYHAIQFRRLLNTASGLTYSVWESTDLSDWTELNLAIHEIDAVNQGDGSELVTVRGSATQSGPGSTERTFLQVRVALP